MAPRGAWPSNCRVLPPRLLGAIAAALCAAAAPTVAIAQVAAVTEAPNRGLKVIPLSLTTSDGKRHRYQVELAATPEQQQRGLMFRRAMARDRGMLFPFTPARPATFWMRNTWIPLDLIFVGTDRRVLSIGRGEPMSEALIDSGGPAIAVLELNAGEALRIGLRPGDRVDW